MSSLCPSQFLLAFFSSWSVRCLSVALQAATSILGQQRLLLLQLLAFKLQKDLESRLWRANAIIWLNRHIGKIQKVPIRPRLLRMYSAECQAWLRLMPRLYTRHVCWQYNIILWMISFHMPWHTWCCSLSFLAKQMLVDAFDLIGLISRWSERTIMFEPVECDTTETAC